MHVLSMLCTIVQFEGLRVKSQQVGGAQWMGHPYGLRTDDTIVSNVRYNSALSLVIAQSFGKTAPQELRA